MLEPATRTVSVHPPAMPFPIPAHFPRVRSVRSLTRLNVKDLPPPSLAKLTTPFLNLQVRATSSWGNFWLGTYIKGLRLCRLRRSLWSNTCRQSSSLNPFSTPWITFCGGYRGRISDFGKGLWRRRILWSTQGPLQGCRNHLYLTKYPGGAPKNFTGNCVDR